MVRHVEKQATLPETNIAPEKMVSQKERIVFQPSTFGCELLVFGEGAFHQHQIQSAWRIGLLVLDFLLR